MGDVVPLRCEKVETSDGPHLSGEAICGACGHEWVLVAPVGGQHFDCPKCNRMWGAVKHAIEPETAWRCNCGEQLFWLTPKGAMCRRCGIVPTDWV